MSKWQSARPNFFLLLGLNPDASWDQASFEKTLGELRLVWSRESAGMGRKALLARKNLALISQIQQVMTSLDQRTQEAEMARQERALAEQAAYRHFEQQLALLNAKDAVEQEEIEKFVAAFQHLCPPAEVRRRLRVRVLPSNQPAQSFDAATARAITDRLDFLGLHTLYELLQLPASSATPLLAQAAETLYTNMVTLAPAAETTAQMELAGMAREVFKSEVMRSSYDALLRRASLVTLLKGLEENVSRSNKQEIHTGQVSLFLEQARQQGWSSQEALEQLKEHAHGHGWVVLTPALPKQVNKPAITYQIRTARRFGGCLVLSLNAPPETTLPILLLVSMQGRLPLRKAAGQVMQRIKATVGRSGRLNIDLRVPPLPPQTFGQLFFEDDLFYQEFIIHHPGEQQMKLS